LTINSNLSPEIMEKFALSSKYFFFNRRAASDAI
jgi:hypothetical protein